MAAETPSAVPDVLAPGLRVVFCGINPGRFSDAAAAHFANPRNDFWRLLHAGGFTPRLFDPGEQFELLELEIGVTNAAYRTTPGSGDLRKGDFAGSAERLESIARALEPRFLAFVGKEAYRGPFGERAGARAPGADARLDAALRAPVDLTGERSRAVGRAPSLVHGAPRARAGLTSRWTARKGQASLRRAANGTIATRSLRVRFV